MTKEQLESMGELNESGFKPKVLKLDEYLDNRPPIVEDIPEPEIPKPNWGQLYNFSKLDRKDRKRLEEILTPKMSKYTPHYPTPKQAAFLLLDSREAFFGGAAGGGKSDALLMAALQYVDIPGYSAILFRRTYSDLTLSGALMDRMSEWLAPAIQRGEVRWIEKLKTYIFYCPGGGQASISFGYLEHDADKYRYQGAEFQFIGFDEVTQLLETCYRYLFSRLRRLKGVPIPLRVRGASNPGGSGHEWVKRRFIIEAREKGRIFIPAKMEDNPYLDQEEYEQSLNELDPITRAQLRSGNWDVKTEGSIIHREWFNIVDAAQVPRQLRKVRFWDFAATAVSKKSRDPDYTVGTLLGELNGFYYVLDVRRVRKRPFDVERLVRQAAMLDGIGTPIYIEQEPGSEGIHLIDHYTRNVLRGHTARGIRSTGSKLARALPFSAAAEQGRVYVVRAAWNGDWFDELEAFPEVDHDDQVDSVSGAFGRLHSTIQRGAIPLEELGSSYWAEEDVWAN